MNNTNLTIRLVEFTSGGEEIYQKYKITTAICSQIDRNGFFPCFMPCGKRTGTATFQSRSVVQTDELYRVLNILTVAVVFSQKYWFFLR